MNEHAKPPGWPRIKIYAAIAIAFVLVAAVGVPVYLANYGTEQQDQKEAAQAGQQEEQAEKKDLAQQVKEACDAGGEAAKRLTAQGLCGKAKEIIQEPEKKVPPAKTITEAEVRQAVREEVDRRRLTLSPQQVATITTSAAALVPKPKDGKTPTTAQIQPLVSAAVATFCANDKCRGEDGTDAPPVTSDQLTATLRAYCSTRNDCIGRDGTNGDDGNGIAAVTTVEGPDGVKVTMTFTDERDPVSFVVLHGKQGPIGPTGPAVESWTWTDAAGVTYTCTDPEKDLTYTCASQPLPAETR